ncbi:hypothetical protein [Pleionea sp. CnH1-48]|uniref:hypothetical protein n=1 Tax=Pleionea sp. CnH1-48 TaxID=2954494 RepID=UPI0020977F8F|nr:hypothetical protein [Pleionea sp. CnH1-48]MCO7225261.1 hypothetical protein [Pleionea sp. CnH1-48]
MIPLRIKQTHCTAYTAQTFIVEADILDSFQASASYYEVAINNKAYPVLSIHENKLKLLSSEQTLPQTLSLVPKSISIEDPELIITDSNGLIIASHLLLKHQKQWQAKRLLLISNYQENTLFKPRPSQIMVSSIPPYAIASVPLWEDLGFASRLCHPDHPGCYDESPLSLSQRLKSSDSEIESLLLIGDFSEELDQWDKEFPCFNYWSVKLS